MTGFIDTYTFTQFGTTGNYSATAILHTFSSPLHTHWNVVTSRILATDLLQSHVKSSFHSIIPFLLFLAAANSEDST
jgi:hypothetical protein